MEYEEAKSKFIQTWGALGSSWGINRTMAQIHALLLISQNPLSTEDIMKELSISRGNANMNTRGLIDMGIVSKELVAGERKEYFSAGKDIWELARQISRARRQREIEPVLKVLNELSELRDVDNKEEVATFNNVVNDLKDFTTKADNMLEKFTNSDEHWFYKTLMKLVK